ncbi:MAG: phenylalanine--tRNA ligase subunit beta, partial [Gammaproteobacteria bacterium]
ALTLDADMLVIADDDKAIALAGIMGGANSVIDADTSELVLEAAWFNPAVIAGRARRIGFHTDASHRFERGVDYTLQAQAIDLASQLIVEICGGQAHTPSVATDTEQLPTRKSIHISAAQIDAVLGFAFPRHEIATILTCLGMSVAVEGETYQVTPPSYRFDITITEDLIEELARVWGYDKVPVASVKVEKLANQAPQDLTPRRDLQRLLVDKGYHEAISYSFIDEKTASWLSNTSTSVKLINPLSAELAVMRTSLLPSLAKALSYNVNRQQHDMRLYEFGHGYTQDKKGGVLHTEKLAAIATGEALPMQWGYRARAMDFFDIKGDLEFVFAQLGVLDDIHYQRAKHEFLHPGQSATVFYGEQNIGFVGALHPNVQKNLDIDSKVFAFEIDIATIIYHRSPVAESLSKYPEIRRDISVLMAQGYQSADILAAIRAASSELVTDVRLFDVYIGRNIPRNTKSMAIAIYLQDKTQTLTDEQADAVIARITQMLSENFNAKLRG